MRICSAASLKGMSKSQCAPIVCSIFKKNGYTLDLGHHICSWAFKGYYCIKKAVLHVINSRALIGEKPCINKAVHALLMHGYATFKMIVPGHRFADVTRCVLSGPRTRLVRGNYVVETSVKRQNKIVQVVKIVANVFCFYVLIAIEHGFSMH